jgi:hypothetical protein
MADAPPNGEELAVHQPRFSLLDGVKQQLKSSQISRILFVFSVADDAASRVAHAELEKWVAAKAADDDSTPVTGVVVGLGSWTVVLLEGKTDAIMAGFCHLAELATKEKSVLVASHFHLFHISELRGVRVFPGLPYLPFAKKPEGTMFENSVPQRVVDVYTGMLTYGCRVLDALGFPEDPAEEAPEVDAKQIAEVGINVSKANPTLLPTHDQIESIASSGSVFPYSTFHDLFVGPIHLELESSKLWPVPPPLSY